MNTLFTHQRKRDVKFKWKQHNDKTASLTITFQEGSDESMAHFFFDITPAEVMAWLRASYDEFKRENYVRLNENFHDVNFQERARRADWLAREVERV